MKYINVFGTEDAFNTAKTGLARPQLSYITENGNVYSLSDTPEPGPTIEFVDLGLSVKWASYNLGATHGQTSDSWKGNYYAWGETEPKDSYAWDNYAHGTETNLTKYNATDGKTTLESTDDAATAYASTLRMPTMSETEELFIPSKITKENVSDYQGISGLSGFTFTSKVAGYEGNSIFIPDAGYQTGILPFTINMTMWTSSLNNSDIKQAKAIYTDELEEMFFSTVDRYTGLPVRPVQDKN